MNSLRKIIEKLKNVDISNWIKQNFGLYSVRKKVFLLSKLSGALIIGKIYFRTNHIYK